MNLQVGRFIKNSTGLLLLKIWKIDYIPDRSSHSSHKKYGHQYCSSKWVYCFVGQYLSFWHIFWMFENQTFNIPRTLQTLEALETIRKSQTNKKQSQLTKSFLGLVWNLKKSSNIYSMYKLAKILQTSCFTTFGSSACHESLSWHVQLPNPPP